MAETAATTGQKLAFLASGRRCFVAADRVREVLRLPPLTTVPRGPDSLLGIGNVRGEPMAVLSVARLLGLPSGHHRQLILIDGHAAAWAVDRVEGVTESEAPCMEAALEDALRSTFSDRPIRERRTVLSNAAQAQAQADAEHLSLLSFAIGDQIFALPLDEIEGVAHVPAAIARMPHADAVTLGSMDWRSGTVPLFSLAGLLALAEDRTPAARVLIVRVGGHRLGLIVDRVEMPLHVPVDTVDPVPLALLRGEAEAVIRAIHRPGHGRRLVSILAADQLLRREITEKLTATAAPAPAAPRQADERAALLLFRSAGERMALPVDLVRQIAPAPSYFSPVPQGPAFLRGMTSHQGQAISVVDLAHHLSGEPEDGRKARLLILSTAGTEAALLVEAVEGIVHVPCGNIAPSPLPDGEDMAPFTRVITLDEGRTATLMLSPPDLFGQLQSAIIDQATQPRTGDA